jgi:hypothetical protein
MIIVISVKICAAYIRQLSLYTSKVNNTTGLFYFIINHKVKPFFICFPLETMGCGPQVPLETWGCSP